MAAFLGASDYVGDHPFINDIASSGSIVRVGSGGYNGAYAVRPYWHGMGILMSSGEGMGDMSGDGIGDLFKSIWGGIKSAGKAGLQLLRENSDGIKELGTAAVVNTLQNLPQIQQAAKENGAKGVFKVALRNVLAPTVKDAVASHLSKMTSQDIANLSPEQRELLNTDRHEGSGAAVDHVETDIKQALPVLLEHKPFKNLENRFVLIQRAAEQLASNMRADQNDPLHFTLTMIKDNLKNQYGSKEHDPDIDMLLGLVETIVTASILLYQTAKKSNLPIINHQLDKEGGSFFSVIAPFLGPIAKVGLPILGNLLGNVPVVGGLLKGVANTVAGSLSGNGARRGVCVDHRHALQLQHMCMHSIRDEDKHDVCKIASDGVVPFMPGLNSYGYYLTSDELQRLLRRYNLHVGPVEHESNARKRHSSGEGGSGKKKARTSRN